VPFVEPKPQRPHEPQLGAAGNAGPADIARVLRDIGLVEDDVERGCLANDEILNPNV
jgi:hypothetical protein